MSAEQPTHPGADFDVTGEERRFPTVEDYALVMQGLFVITDGKPLEADTIDVPIVGEVDDSGVVRWAGGGR